jgi:N-acetylneuraminic acid mutarotase
MRSRHTVLLVGIALFIGAGTVRPGQQTRQLSMSERVPYQYAIEEVYWRHRIWPKENPNPKPSLDEVMSREQIEKKVTDYLRKSQLVADERGRGITPSELQDEMDRMAADTKHPEVLRELFEALGNVPFVIAECLARPIVAERLISELTAQSGVEAFVSSAYAISPNASVLGTNTSTSCAYKLPEIAVGAECANDTWIATSIVNVPDARYRDSALWTGSEMIIWGGSFTNNGWHYFNTGGRYDPATDTWTATSTINAPIARDAHAAVWTGNEMIVWGGGDNTDFFNTGGRYNPADDTWTATGAVNVPTARVEHSAVWTGSEMMVWGGYGCGGNCNLNSGGRYNPSTDSWTATSTINAPEARWYHTVQWTGSEMVVWGGTNQTTYLNTGGRYNPNTDSWMATSVPNDVLGRVGHTAVWTGGEMVVWGGTDSTFNDCNTGGRYNPSTDSWTASNTVNAPSARDSHTAVWTGTEMIVWGGIFCYPCTDFNNGGRYNPGTDSWVPTGTANAPFAREDHTAVWTGSDMIVWGGYNYAHNLFFNTGGRYCAQPSTPIVQRVVSRKRHSFAGDFDLSLPLSGTPAIESRSGGATNDYTIVLSFSANVSVNGNPQAAVTTGIGAIGSNGAPNGGQVVIAGNIVTIPLTNVANAQRINVTLYGVNGSTDFVIPMRVLIGDTNGNGTVNAADVSQNKSRVGQQINATNFRADVNADGYIDAADVALVKSRLGTGLP